MFEVIRKLNNYLSIYWFFVLYGSVVYVFIDEGSFPMFSDPDPNQNIPFFGMLFESFHLSNVLFFSGAIFNGIFFFQNYPNRMIERSLLFFLTSLSLRILIQIFDPGGFAEWFMD